MQYKMYVYCNFLENNGKFLHIVISYALIYIEYIFECTIHAFQAYVTQ